MDLFEDGLPSEALRTPVATLTSPLETTLDLPAEVRLFAAVSRLLDFHQARSTGSNVSVPEVPETAAHNLHLAISLNNALGQWELEQGQALVSLKQLRQLAGEHVKSVDDAALEHCVSCLPLVLQLVIAV